MSTTKPFARNRLEYILNLISPSKSDKILNIGISNIPEVEMLLEGNVKECWTLDIDSKKLETAKKFLKKTRLVKADVLTYNGFKKGYFDKIIILEVLEHLDNDSAVLMKLNSLLKKNGTLVVAVPNDSLWHLLNPVKYIEHKRHYSNNRIKMLLAQTGFRINHFNLVECWTLLANLWVHLLNKFILRRSSKFGVFGRKADATYGQFNKSGLDIVIRAAKI